MHITDISLTKKGRWSIYIDDEFYGVIHTDVYIHSRISSGDDIEKDELDEMIARSSELITRERALKLLSSRSYTSKILYEKLLTYADEESAASAISRMQELGLLDDHDYARRYAADCMNLKCYSHLMTRRALKEKGISRDIIDEVMQDCDVDEETLIARAIKKKYMKYLHTAEGQKKTLDALNRRGFYYDDARSVVQNLLSDEEYYD